jgi:hypothetical protein
MMVTCSVLGTKRATSSWPTWKGPCPGHRVWPARVPAEEAQMAIDPETTNPHLEPCEACGEETAVGSVFFSDRVEGNTPEGRKYFVCSECRKRVRLDDRHLDERHVDWSDPEVYRAVVGAAQFVFRDSSF